MGNDLLLRVMGDFSEFINFVFVTFSVFVLAGVYTRQLIRAEHSLGYKVFTLDFGFKISGHPLFHLRRFRFGLTQLRVDVITVPVLK